MTDLLAELTDDDAEAARVIPCLLLDGDRLVKTRRFAEPAYVGDPVNVLSLFNAFEVDEMVLLDIGGARSRTPASLEALRRYATECFIPLAYGGGLSTMDQVEAVLAAGFEKVVLNTAIVDHPGVVSEASRVYGAQAVVASVDVRGGIGGEAFVAGGARPVGAGPLEWARRAEELGVGEILLTSIDREGTMEGWDLELIGEVASAVSVPVIAHGGAAKRKELGAPVREAHASAVAAGSLFVFQGPQRGVLINYPARAQLVRLMQP